VAQVAQDLGISPYTLNNWVKADREQGRAAQDGGLGESERREPAGCGREVLKRFPIRGRDGKYLKSLDAV
jgi:transposase-like protein